MAGCLVDNVNAVVEGDSRRLCPFGVVLRTSEPVGGASAAGERRLHQWDRFPAVAV